jgi:hydrocephalus-inducing protein
VPQVITTISGACTGLSVLLASDSIPFGTVVLGSRTTKRLLLSNNGDLGCKFAWDTSRFGSNFGITPAGRHLAYARHSCAKGQGYILHQHT